VGNRIKKLYIILILVALIVSGCTSERIIERDVTKTVTVHDMTMITVTSTITETVTPTPTRTVYEDAARKTLGRWSNSTVDIWIYREVTGNYYLVCSNSELGGPTSMEELRGRNMPDGTKRLYYVGRGADTYWIYSAEGPIHLTFIDVGVEIPFEGDNFNEGEFSLWGR